jgi:hypothetical protein
MDAGIALSTEHERTVIDVIDAAMARIDPRMSVSILSGMLVLLCKKYEITPDELHNFIDERFGEHAETFDG